MIYKLLTTSYKLRAMIDATAASLFIGFVYQQDAPGWALALIFYIATRPSRLDQAADIAALQTTVKALKDEIELDNIERITERNAAGVGTKQSAEGFLGSTSVPGYTSKPRNYGRGDVEGD